MTLIDEKTRFKAEQFGEGYYFVIQVTYDFPGGAHVASVTGFTEFGVACPASWAHANLLAAAPRLLAALKQARAALPDAWAAVACNVPHAVVEEINAAIAEAEAPGPRKGSTAGHDCKAVTERAVHPWGGRKLLTALILAVTVAASPSSGAVEPLRDGTSMRAASQVHTSTPTARPQSSRVISTAAILPMSGADHLGVLLSAQSGSSGNSRRWPTIDP